MTKISTDKQKIEEILTRGVHETFTKEELYKKLTSGKQLHLKLGTDVTGPTLHLGHSVVHRKIRDFQELGHKVTLIIGDFTTLVGDHSDKVDMRSEANESDIKKNEETYKEQFFKTVLRNQTEIRHNSEWLEPLNFNDVIHLAKQFSIQQILEREAFMLRYKNQKPIMLDEFLYPLMQGYDSIVLNCDIEFGGTDQTFNLLAGRKLMSAFKQTPQSAVVMKLLTGSDGKPMGKSLKNFIPILDNPNDMYGKIMSIADGIVFEYFELVTRIPMNEIEEMKKSVENGENPMKFKKLLAHNIVELYHGKNLANSAAIHFEKTVQNKEIAEDDVQIINVSGSMPLLDFLKKSLGAKISGNEMKRTVEQGGVEVNGNKMTNPLEMVNFKSGDIIRFGKRVFLRVN